MEAAPRMGYADLIADLSETGTTLRENHLRPIDGGTNYRFGSGHDRQSPQRCASRRTSLKPCANCWNSLKRISGRANIVSLRANISGESVADVQDRILANPALSGTKGTRRRCCRQPAGL